MGIPHSLTAGNNETVSSGSCQCPSIGLPIAEDALQVIKSMPNPISNAQVEHRLSKSSLDHTDEPSDASSPHDGSKDMTDLEKANTAHGGISSAISGGRVSRTQSLIRRTTRPGFSHALSHVSTSADVLVDFEGADDPYRPINWSFKKKTITTALYGLTTMCTTWATSV